MADASNPSEDVKAFFRNPAIAKKVLDLVVTNKPIGWSPRSNAPYYKEEYAAILKDAADTMLKTREDCLYAYSDWPRLSKNTLYLLVNQSMRYLVEKMDTDDRIYGKWCECVLITKEAAGVLLSFTPASRSLKNFDYVKPKMVANRDFGPKWKTEVDEYLEDDRKTKPLHIDKLCLTPDEIKQLRDSLRPLSGIIFEVTSFAIKIVKTN